MRKHGCYSLTALALLTPVAWASGDEDRLDLDRVHVPALADVKVSATPGSGVTLDAGDDFKMNIYNRLQVQFRYSAIGDTGVGAANAPDVATFRVRRARTRFKGHAFSPKTRYSVYLEWAANGAASNNLLDVYIEQEAWSNDEWTLNARGGTMKTLFGKEATGTSGGLEFTERSLAARTFSDRRSTGLLVLLDGMQGKLHIHLGSFNTETAAGGAAAAGIGTLNGDNELNYTGGVRYDINGDMGSTSYSQGDLEGSRGTTEEWNGSVHLNGWYGNEATAGSTDIDVIAVNVGGAFKGFNAHALAEFFYNKADQDLTGSSSADSIGINVQGSYLFGKSGFGAGARVSYVKVDTVTTGIPGIYITPASGGVTGGGVSLAGAAGKVLEVSIGGSKFFDGHNRKVQADITIQKVDFNAAGATDPTNIIFRVMATLGV